MKARLSLGIFIAVSVVVSLVSLVFAYPEGWGDDIRLTYAAGFSDLSTIAVDSNNNIHITWSDDRDGNQEIYYTKLDNHGNMLVDDTRLTNQSSRSFYSSIATDSSNKIHIAWQDMRNGKDEIYYTKLGNNGNTIVDDVRLTPDSTNAGRASVGVDSNNNVHIAWYDNKDGNWEIYYTKLDNNGGTLVDDTRLTFNPSASWIPDLAIDSNNNVHITWYDSRTGLWDIYYMKLDNYGGKIINDTRLTFNDRNSREPSIAIDSYDNVHITWMDDIDIGNFEIFYTKLDNNGNTIVNDTRLTNTGGDSADPDIVADLNNNIHVTWYDQRYGSPEIFYTKLNNNGNTLIDDTRLTNSSGSAVVPFITTDSNNNLHVTWPDSRMESWEIYYKRSYLYPLPDLVITPDDISFNLENPIEEELVTIFANVSNIGIEDAYNVRVVYYADDFLMDGNSFDIPAGESVLAEFAWVAQEGTHTIKIVVDPLNLIEESDETNNEAEKDIFVISYKYEILAIPLNWQGTQQEFENNVNTQIDFFLNDVPLNACRERVKIKIPDISRYNFNFSCLSFFRDASPIKNFAKQIEDIGEVEEYDVIIGFVETTPCPPVEGVSNGVDTIWAETRYDNNAAHEIGHLFGLSDEYCSNPAGSIDCRCNDAGVFDPICFVLQGFQMDINPLDANLGCDATEGGGCCETQDYDGDGQNDTCSGGVLGFGYVLCCEGNIVNEQNGRDIMSYSNAPGPRAFDDYGRAHLANQEKLTCESLRDREIEIVGIIDVSLFVYQNDTVNDNGIILVQGEPSEYHQAGGNYNLTVLDNESNILFVQSFELYFDYMGPIESGVNYSGINYTYVDLSYKIPYSEDMYELRLYKNQEILFSKILNFCDSDYVCESGETYLTCPDDCPLDQPDGICILENDGVCDPDCAKGLDLDCAPTLQPIDNITKVEGSLVVIVANATDPNDENLTYSIDDPRFNQNNNIFTWQTHFGDMGFYEVTVSVTDGYLEDSQAVGIRIYRPPKPPLPYVLWGEGW